MNRVQDCPGVTIVSISWMACQPTTWNCYFFTLFCNAECLSLPGPSGVFLLSSLYKACAHSVFLGSRWKKGVCGWRSICSGLYLPYVVGSCWSEFLRKVIRGADVKEKGKHKKGYLVLGYQAKKPQELKHTNVKFSSSTINLQLHATAGFHLLPHQ